MMLLEPQPSPGRGRITSCVLTRPTLRNEWRSGGSHYDISQSHFSAVNILHTPTGPPTHTTRQSAGCRACTTVWLGNYLNHFSF